MVENKISISPEKDENKAESLQTTANDMDINTDFRVYLTTFLMLAFVGLVILIKLAITIYVVKDADSEENDFTPLEQNIHSNFK